MSASAVSRGVYIVAAKRTACGTFGGSLKSFSATELATVSAKAAVAAAGIDPKLIDSVVYGNVQQTSGDAAYLARHVGLHAGNKISTPALTVNRLCGSGFEAVVQGTKDILLHQAKVVLAGGTESMSQAPYAVRDIRWGSPLGKNLTLEDTLWAGLSDSYCKLPMGITAENLAVSYNITRTDADAFALQSQQRWAKSHAAGVFAAEITPVEIKGKKGVTHFAVDEHPRPQSTMDTMAKLPSVFKKDGTVTAASSSGICDGAASLILVDEETLKAQKLTPLARVAGFSVAGVDPSIMGIGPVPAIRMLWEKTGVSKDQVDLYEVNEAFASQCIAVQRDLGLDPAKLNTNGGAIAIGHPLGMSGARILTHLTHELQRTKGKYAIGSACIGGGQGIAVLLERA